MGDYIMNDNEKKQNIVNKIEDICEELDSVRSLLSRSEYELQSNSFCGKTFDKGSIKEINTDIMNIVNDLEILGSKIQIESSNL